MQIKSIEFSWLALDCSQLSFSSVLSHVDSRWFCDLARFTLWPIGFVLVSEGFPSERQLRRLSNTDY